MFIFIQIQIIFIQIQVLGIRIIRNYIPTVYYLIVNQCGILFSIIFDVINVTLKFSIEWIHL